MSLNTAHAKGGVLIYNGERILIYYDGVEMSFDMDCDMPQFKGKKKGRAYLTTHRVIFNTRDNREILQSFSMPFGSMRQLELEQPVFGANYIQGRVTAQQGGNWDGEGKWKMWFNKGGAIEFGQALLQAGKLASRYQQRPPPYIPPTGEYYQAPPPAYAPPQDQMYSFVPVQTFPNAPPMEGVYTTDAPPPYPGIDPRLDNPTMSKAAEAGCAEPVGAYYNPADPHNVYVPPPATAPPQYGEPPPSYSEVSKKKQ